MRQPAPVAGLQRANWKRSKRCNASSIRVLCARRELPAEPGPLLQQQLALLPVGLEIDERDDFVADQHGQGEVAELPLLLGNVCLEAMLVVEEQMQPLALMDQRVERRQDMDELFAHAGGGIERLRPQPVLQRCRRLRARREPTSCGAPSRRSIAASAACAGGRDGRPNRGSRRPASAARGRADSRGSPLRSRLGQPLPAEMPRHQLVRLEHARALADGQQPAIEGQLQALASRACGSPRHGLFPPARRRRCRGSSARHGFGCGEAPCADPPA